MDDIMKIFKSLKKSGSLLKGVSETIENETKEQNGGFLSMILGALAASLSRNLLTGRGFIQTSEWTIRAAHDC